MRPLSRDVRRPLCDDFAQQPNTPSPFLSTAEKQVWNNFFKDKHLKDEDNFVKFDLRAGNRENVHHSAMHDAESVFYIMVLFFSRMRRRSPGNKKTEEPARSKVFQNLVEKCFTEENKAFPPTLLDGSIDPDFIEMLQTMRGYLSVPWYNFIDTGKGKANEFHLHVLMQKLILKKLFEMGSDITLANSPQDVTLPKRYQYYNRPSVTQTVLVDFRRLVSY